MAFSNSIVYQEEWAAKAQERLDYPLNWKNICRVEYTNTRVINNPYMSTVPAAASHTRGTTYAYSTMSFTNEYLTINQSYKHATAIDRADLAQTDFVKQMDMADLAATLLNEQLEADMLANYGMMTSFDNTALGGSAGNITVTTSNIDDIIRAIKREIIEANGLALAQRNGIFICWRAADFEKLEAYCQANGFQLADNFLKNGIDVGFHYGGIDHYVSNKHTANHLIAGVKNIFHLGILKDTYGQVVINQDPCADTTMISGIGVVMRVDWEFKVWTNTKAVLFDVKVS